MGKERKVLRTFRMVYQKQITLSEQIRLYGCEHAYPTVNAQYVKSNIKNCDDLLRHQTTG